MRDGSQVNSVKMAAGAALLSSRSLVLHGPKDLRLVCACSSLSLLLEVLDLLPEIDLYPSVARSTTLVRTKSISINIR